MINGNYWLVISILRTIPSAGQMPVERQGQASGVSGAKLLHGECLPRTMVTGYSGYERAFIGQTDAGETEPLAITENRD
jgi:hypothetical protein